MINKFHLIDERVILIILPLSIFLFFIGKKEIDYIRQKVALLFRKIMHFILEKDIEELILITKLSISVDLFQTIRLTTVLICLFMVTMITKRVSYEILIIGVIIYKAFYVYLKYLFLQYRSQIKQQLPYFLKCIVYLCYIYPVANSLNKAVELVPDIFKDK